MESTLIAVLMGLFGGIGGTILWEGILGPFRRRRNAARAIAAENSINLQMVAGLVRSPAYARKHIPSDFRLTTIAFDGLSDRVAEFPPEVLRSVLHWYSLVEYLNETVAAYAELVDRRRALDDENPAVPGLERDLAASIEAFYRILGRAIEVGGRTQDLVFEVGESWRIRREKVTYMTPEGMSERVRDFLAERDRNLNA